MMVSMQRLESVISEARVGVGVGLRFQAGAQVRVAIAFPLQRLHSDTRFGSAGAWVVGDSGIFVPLLTAAAFCRAASTRLPALIGFKMEGEGGGGLGIRRFGWDAVQGGAQAGLKALYTCMSWYAYAAMFGSSTRSQV